MKRYPKLIVAGMLALALAVGAGYTLHARTEEIPGEGVIYPATSSSTSAGNSSSTPSSSGGGTEESSSRPPASTSRGAGSSSSAPGQESPASGGAVYVSSGSFANGTGSDGATSQPNGGQPSERVVKIFGAELPIGGLDVRGGWSAFDLLLVCLLLLLGAFAALRARRSGRGTRVRYGVSAACSLPLALFLLLEDFSQAYLFNRWSLLFGGLFVACLAALVVAYRPAAKRVTKDD